MSANFFRLDGKVAVVTGGGQGIGEAICRRLAGAGAKVGVFDMNSDSANRVAREIGGVPLVGDLTKEADLDRDVSGNGVDHVSRVIGRTSLEVKRARSLWTFAVVPLHHCHLFCPYDLFS